MSPQAIQAITWLLMAAVVGIAFDKADRPGSSRKGWLSESAGINILLITIYACLAATCGFIVEWLVRSFWENKLTATQIPLTAAGWVVAFGALTQAFKSWRTVSKYKSRAKAIITTMIIGGLIFITPRSLTYDTGLYHLPFVDHLTRLGLEWNAGWVHTRYGYFSGQLYGQAMLHRLIGADSEYMLPSINVLFLAGTIAYLAELTGNTKKTAAKVATLLASFRVIWLLFIPSEASQSMHSYNADFSLGCLVLVAGIAVYSDERFKRSQLGLRFCSLVGSIKLSGLFCILPIAPSLIGAYEKRLTRRRCWSVLQSLLLALTTVLIIAVTSWVQTGYLVYPVASTGPLRQGSIAKPLVKEEAEKWTVAFARYAYAGRLAEIKTNAAPGDWLPAWSRSDNGHRILFSLATSLCCIGLTLFNKSLRVFRTPSLGLFVFWILAIGFLPPDPRFYMGNTWLGEFMLFYMIAYLASFQLEGKIGHRIPFGKDLSAQSSVLIYALSCLIFVGIWRKSEYSPLAFPAPKAVRQFINTTPYKPKKNNSLIYIQDDDPRCWGAPSPCKG